jgi:hypothetical protein
MIHAVKARYTRLARHLPDRWMRRLEASFLNPVQLLERIQIKRAVQSGPPYRPSHRKIILDITAACDLGCINCNRSCSENQAPSTEHMATAQIEKFIRESIAQGRRWEEIALEGGEPTLHPDLDDILRLLLHYRESFSPRTHIQLLTNGYGTQSLGIRKKLLHQGILVINTRKSSRLQSHHCAFNIAPRDLPKLAGLDFSQGCFLPSCYGLGLTRHGYYPHPICGGIDRVFGFDIGRKHLPSPSDSMQDQFSLLCSLCGYLRHCLLSKVGNEALYFEEARSEISASWEAAYTRYRRGIPMLERF